MQKRTQKKEEDKNGPQLKTPFKSISTSLTLMMKTKYIIDLQEEIIYIYIYVIYIITRRERNKTKGSIGHKTSHVHAGEGSYHKKLCR